MDETIDRDERLPRIHGPVTDGRIAYALDGLRKRRRGYLSEAILLLEAIQHERQHSLILDTTNAQMMPMPHVNAAAGGVSIRYCGWLQPRIVHDE